MVFYYYPRNYCEGSDDWLIYMVREFVRGTAVLPAGFQQAPPRPLCVDGDLVQGKDKFENEDLIKYGLPVDVW